MRAIFNDEKLQQQFDELGYVKLQLLDEAEVDRLLNFYENTKTDNKLAGFHISLDNKDPEFIKLVGEEIKTVLAPNALPHLNKCKIFTASYVVKESGLQNIVPPHQDWSFVDETEFYSCTMWTPLQDVTMDNGALGVIKGSHKLFNHHRSSPSPQSKSPLADHVFTLFPYVEIIEMKAGETLIFNNKLIHASPPNTSNQPRIGVGIGITQEEASLRHYYHIPGSNPPQLNVHEVDEEFYTWYNNGRLSDLYDSGKTLEEVKKLDTINRVVPELTKEEMEQLVLSLPGIKKNETLTQRLAELFNYNMDGTKNEAESGSAEAQEYVDNRSFFQKYTPKNIFAEIKWRLGGRK